MMCCAQCRLRPKTLASAPGKTGYTRPPLPEGLFFCVSPNCTRFGGEPPGTTACLPDTDTACIDCPQRGNVHLCPHDLWVMTELARGDEFAAGTAHHALDTLVSCESEELVCELFLNADPETRADLWRRMTACHPGRLDLLNQLFERLCLPPLDKGEWPCQIADYRLAIA